MAITRRIMTASRCGHARMKLQPGVNVQMDEMLLDRPETTPKPPSPVRHARWIDHAVVTTSCEARIEAAPPHASISRH